MSRKGTIEDLFKPSDEDVEYFSSVFGAHNELMDATPRQIRPPEFITQESRLIRIEHGWHDEDYVWHISAFHPKRPWKATQNRIVYAIAQTLNKRIPDTVKVTIGLPRRDWEIDEFTVRAYEIRDLWNVKKESLEASTKELFEVLGVMV